MISTNDYVYSAPDRSYAHGAALVEERFAEADARRMEQLNEILQNGRQCGRCHKHLRNEQSMMRGLCSLCQKKVIK